MKTIRVQDIAQLRATVQQTHAESKRPFCYIFASEDPQTGKSWCPDCVKAQPFVYEFVQGLSDAVLIEVPTGQRPEYLLD
jgi:thiol-disulfide isomerase/thioredoxin